MAERVRSPAFVPAAVLVALVLAATVLGWHSALGLALVGAVCAQRVAARRCRAQERQLLPSWEALPEDADETVEHDYVIVGAGCAGCALTASLAQAGKRVLLLEFGPSTAAERPVVRWAKKWWSAAMAGWPISTPYRTVPQGSLRRRTLQAYRGIGGGGSGNINAGLWSRGRRDDYIALWPWDIADVERSFEAVESVLGVQRIPATGPGLLFERMATEAGYPAVDGRGWVHDGWESGVISTFAPVSGDVGERRGGFQRLVSPLLAPGGDDCKRPGVEVKDYFKVARVILEGGSSAEDGWSEMEADRPCRVIGLEVAVVDAETGAAKSRRRLLLRNGSAEVVLCAGAIETPKILMLSGLGCRRELAALGIPCRKHCPQVGRNLQDHVIVPVVHAVKTGAQRVAAAETNAVGSHGFLHVQVRARRPGLVGPDIIARGQVLVQDSSCADVISPDCVCGIFGWHSTRVGEVVRRALFVVLSYVMAAPGVRHLVRSSATSLLCLMSPQSYGSVSLTSANPMAPPSINPAYLSDEQDLEAMVAVSDVYSSLIGTSFGRSLCALQLLPGPLFGWGKSREGVRSWLKALACPYFHHVSTCRMAPRGADEEAGVVDSSLRVIGVVGLRVADASVAPRIPCAPTQAMSYMIGHRAAEIILTAYNSM